MKVCERCGAPSKSPDAGPFDDFDYCAKCSRNLCDACMAKGCCGHVPAQSGLEADYPEEKEDDDCCPGCGACPGFTGVDCDETCEWATTGGGAALAPVFSPEQKRRALDLIKPDHAPAMELEEIDALRRQYRSTGGGDGR